MVRSYALPLYAYSLRANPLRNRNPVRAGLVDDPAIYSWSSCTTYIPGTPSRLITFHPRYLALSS